MHAEDRERRDRGARLGILEGRCQWVKESTKRDWLAKRVGELWPKVKS